MNPQTPGILLLPKASLSPLAYNQEALQILAFPKCSAQLPPSDEALARQIRLRLALKTPTGARAFVQELRSGNRTYVCRTIDVGNRATDATDPSTANTLILLERSDVPSHLRHQSAWDKFGLSQREREMAELVTKGLTTKEIASTLNLSPNTVKSFLRLIMAKMGVSTRSGIVGKLLEAERS